MLYAARSGCYDCVEAMIGAGANVNVPTPEGVTPLMDAIDNDRNDVAKLLLDHGANPNVWDWWGRTALYIAVDRKAAAGAAGGGGRGERRVAEAAVVAAASWQLALESCCFQHGYHQRSIGRVSILIRSSTCTALAGEATADVSPRTQPARDARLVSRRPGQRYGSNRGASYGANPNITSRWV